MAMDKMWKQSLRRVCTSFEGAKCFQVIQDANGLSKGSWAWEA